MTSAHPCPLLPLTLLTPLAEHLLHQAELRLRVELWVLVDGHKVDPHVHVGAVPGGADLGPVTGLARKEA